MYSRRELGKLAVNLAAASIPLSRLHAAKKINSTIHGVPIGAQTYSFRELPLDGAIDAMKQIGLGECELFMGHVEPKGMGGDDLRQWRLTTPISYFEDIRGKFNAAGIQIYAYSLNFNDGFSSEELERGFEMTKALGTDLITTSTTLTCAKRLAPLAEKHAVRIALHGHDQSSKPNEFSTRESFAKGLALSPMFYINLDIGHFTAANDDAAAYLEQKHDKILVLHVKDRKKNHGDNVPWGEGDTPIKPVLQLVRSQKWKMPCNIEYEYGKPGLDTVAEVRKCFEYCKQALA
jgi:sugar phosphate isomerase/epimerase